MSIYDSIGGGPAVHAAVDDFYARVVADAQLAPFFPAATEGASASVHRRRARRLRDLPGRDMAAAHAGLAITDADFDAVVARLVDTLTGLGVPEETIGQIGGALAPLRGDIVTAPADELAG